METAAYLGDCKGVIEEDERREIVNFLARNPEAGVAIGGGVRKVRIARPGGGMSGGYRVVYLSADDAVPIFLLAAFARNERANLSETERKAVVAAARTIVETYRRVRS